MLKALKSYWACIGSWYKIIVFALIPLAALLNALIFVNLNAGLIEIALVMSFVILWMVEPMSDHWFMGGIYGKNKGGLEFLQSSNRFSKFMKDIVLVDVIRRAVTYIAVYVLICIVGYLYGVEKEIKLNLYEVCSFIPFLSMFVSQVEALIGRHFELCNQRYSVVMVGFAVEGLLLSYFIKLFLTIAKVWVINAVLFILFVAAAIGTVAYTNKKVEESYYDK